MLLAIAFLIAQQLTSPFATHATAAELFAAPMSDAMHAMHDVHEGHALAHQSLLDDAVPPPALPPARGTSDIWLSKNLPAIPRWPLLQREAIDRLIADSVARLLALQAPIPSQEELPNAKRCEWSYECLYRCGNEPPVAFRVGGTSIVGIALLAAPGLADDAVRRAALLRAIDQVANLATDPEISIEEYDGGFDVRNWAHCFGVRFLIAADRAGLVTDDRRERIHRAIARYADALLKSELPARGGWNYFREDGAFLRGHACTFLSAHCIVSLLDVRDGGYAISISGGDGAAGESAGPRTEPAQSTQPAPPTDAPTDVSTSTSTSTPARDLARERRALDEVIARAFAAIESARQPSGFLGYDTRGMGPLSDERFVPECVGRLMAVEVASIRAGRVNLTRLRQSMQLFREAWSALDAERGRGGAHEAPFGIAPYYFFFACTAAVEAAHALPPKERDEHLAFVRNMILSIRTPSGPFKGLWNDQKYNGSVAYGTAMAILALIDRTEAPTPALPAAATPSSPSKPAPVRSLDRDER